jgi:hypothetical protein
MKLVNGVIGRPSIEKRYSPIVPYRWPARDVRLIVSWR